MIPVEHDGAFTLGHVAVQLTNIFARIHREDGDFQAGKTLVIGRTEKTANQGDHVRQWGESAGVQTNALHRGVIVRTVVFQIVFTVGDDVVG